MDPDREPSAEEVMFPQRARAEQARSGSRAAYARAAEKGRFRSELDDDVAAFITSRNSAYLGTASADGQPYVQHRGGPTGFLRVLDRRTVAFADYEGNRQYITTGNLAENERAFLFLMDYTDARRLKLWGRARVLTAGADMLARIAHPEHSAVVDRAIVFRILAWDWNCSQHIPRLVPG
jgi:uncharacterized protein